MANGFVTFIDIKGIFKFFPRNFVSLGNIVLGCIDGLGFIGGHHQHLNPVAGRKKKYFPDMGVKGQFPEGSFRLILREGNTLP